MATGWEMLGNALAGPDRESAFQEGRLRTAQTENALGMARQRQLQNITLEDVAKQKELFAAGLARSGQDPNGVLSATVLGGMGSDFNSGTSGLLNLQQRDFRNTAADPTTNALARTRALGAVAGRPYSDLEAVGQGGVTNITADQPTVMSTPLGESLIGGNQAQARASDAMANLRDEQRLNPEAFRSASSAGASSGAGGGTGGIKPPSGYMANPNFNPDLPVSAENTPVTYIPGGPADPNKFQPQGAREAAFFNRIVAAGNATMQDLQNIMELNTGASIGVFGTGIAASPGTTIMEATGGNLRLLVSPEEVRQYDTMLGGMNRALTIIEGQGLQGSNTLAASYDNLTLRPQDTLQNKMMKLAQIKQTVSAGLEPHLINPRVPQIQKDGLQYIIDGLEKAVPFTVRDVIALQREGKPGQTLREVSSRQKIPEGANDGMIPRLGAVAPRPTPRLPSRATPGVANTAPRATPGAANTSFGTEDEAQAAADAGLLPPNTRITIGGISGVWE